MNCPVCGEPAIATVMNPVTFSHKGGRNPGLPDISFPGRTSSECINGHKFDAYEDVDPDEFDLRPKKQDGSDYEW